MCTEDFARTGEWYAWFGGVGDDIEVGFLSQTVTIPAGAAVLSFYLSGGSETALTIDYLRVGLDGVKVFEVTGAQINNYPTYKEVSVDVTDYADDGQHTVRFDSTTNAYGVTNFIVDDVSLTVTPPVKLTPVAYLPYVIELPPPPQPPVLNSIANSDNDGNFTVSWTTPAYAATYLLQEDDNAAFSSPATAYTGAAASKNIGGKNIGTYYYHVRAQNGMGNSGWSTTRSVRVTIPPPPCVPAGNWSGTNNQGKPLSFTTSASPCQVDTLTMANRVDCAFGPMTRNTTFTSPTDITGNDFSYVGTIEVVGTFAGNTASGTWHASFYDAVMGWCESSGTWSANHD